MTVIYGGVMSVNGKALDETNSMTVGVKVTLPIASHLHDYKMQDFLSFIEIFANDESKNFFKNFI